MKDQRHTVQQVRGYFTCKQESACWYVYTLVHVSVHYLEVCLLTGNYCLVVLKESKYYDLMKIGFSDLRKEVKSLKSITVGEHTFYRILYGWGLEILSNGYRP